MRNVYRAVVFLSPAYIKSPNCCIEFWEAVQRPEKLTICIMQELPPGVMRYLMKLIARGATVVTGLDELIPKLNDLIENTRDCAFLFTFAFVSACF